MTLKNIHQRTLKKNADEFFFLHNGITAICSKMGINDNVLSVKELNVVNGCQSLSTIYGCSETVKKTSDGYVCRLKNMLEKECLPAYSR